MSPQQAQILMQSQEQQRQRDEAHADQQRIHMTVIGVAQSIYRELVGEVIRMSSPEEPIPWDRYSQLAGESLAAGQAFCERMGMIKVTADPRDREEESDNQEVDQDEADSPVDEDESTTEPEDDPRSEGSPLVLG